MKRICIVPQVHGVGGMVSFRDRFTAGLKPRSIEAVYEICNTQYASVLVIGGTRDLAGLWHAKRRGIRIVQRLNGMNWLHHYLPTGLKHYLRAEYGNLILRLIRSKVADHIVYQSEFAHDWWERVYGPGPASNSVIYNAVDLETFSPSALHAPPSTYYQILLVEGSLMGGYEMGLKTAVDLAEKLVNAYSQALGRPVTLKVAGRVADEIRTDWGNRTEIEIEWAGLVPAEDIPALDRSAHLLYASDINAACPNSVIEALACGLPVLAFDTGALPELVAGNAGRVVPFGSDPWKLETPDIDGLADAAVEILAQQNRFRSGARARAEEAFDLDKMVDHYLQVLV